MAVDGGAYHASRNVGLARPNGRAQAQEAHRDRRRPSAVALPPGQPVGGERVRGRGRADRPDGPVLATVGQAVRGVLAGVARVPSAGGRRVRRFRVCGPQEGPQPAASEFVVRSVVLHVGNIDGVQLQPRRHTAQRERL